VKYYDVKIYLKQKISSLKRLGIFFVGLSFIQHREGFVGN